MKRCKRLVYILFLRPMTVICDYSLFRGDLKFFYGRGYLWAYITAKRWVIKHPCGKAAVHIKHTIPTQAVPGLKSHEPHSLDLLSGEERVHAE